MCPAQKNVTISNALTARTYKTPASGRLTGVVKGDSLNLLVKTGNGCYSKYLVMASTIPSCVVCARMSAVFSLSIKMFMRF